MSWIFYALVRVLALIAIVLTAISFVVACKLLGFY